MFQFLPPANEVWGKVISLQACVCPQGGVPDQVHLPPGTPPSPGTRYTPQDQVHPPGPGTPPRSRYTPQVQVHPPGPGTPHRAQVHPPATEHAGRSGQRAGGTHPTGMQSCLWHFVTLAFVRIYRCTVRLEDNSSNQFVLLINIP